MRYAHSKCCMIGLLTLIMFRVVQSAELTAIPASEFSVLLDLYNSTGGMSWKQRDGWLTRTTAGKWYGVTVENGHVMELRLPKNGLTGSLPPGLAKLSELRCLDLHGNGLSGSIPVQLTRLVNLHHLVLSDNALTGPIPPELGQLHALEQLQLGGNELTGPVPVEFGDLRNLHGLGLSQNWLTGGIPASVMRLPHLQQLILRCNFLTGPLPDVGENGQMPYLELDDNAIVPSDMRALRMLESGKDFLSRGQCCIPAHMPRLLEHLGGKDPTLRHYALKAMAQLGNRASQAVPALTAVLSAEEHGLRRSAAMTMASIGPESRFAVPALLKLMHEEGGGKIAAIRALGGVGPDAKAAIPDLLAALNGGTETERREAAVSLGLIGANDASVIWALTTAMNRRSEVIRIAAAEALVRIRDDDQAMSLLVNEARQGPSAAMAALGSLGPKAKAAVPTLAAIVRTESGTNCADAMRALARIGPAAEEAVVALAGVLEKKDERPGLSVISSFGPWMTNHLFALQALANIGPAAKGAVPIIVHNAEEGNGPIAEAALRALADIGSGAQAAVPALRKLANRSDPHLRILAAVALARAGEVEAAMPILAGELKNERALIRITAMRGIASLGPLAKPIVPNLVVVLKAENVPVPPYISERLEWLDRYSELHPLLLSTRGYALHALGSIGTDAEQAASAVREALVDESTDVRKAAEEALMQISGQVEPRP